MLLVMKDLHLRQFEHIRNRIPIQINQIENRFIAYEIVLVIVLFENKFC